MKTTLCSALVCFSLSSALADPFRNLDFEEYNPGTGLVPGWSFENSRHSPQTLETLPLNLDLRPPFEVPHPYATMYTPGARRFKFADSGNYLLGLVPLLEGILYPWVVRQTGEIPADAKSMSFELGGAQVSLKFNGSEVPLEDVYRTDTTWAGWDFADVSGFAGQTVTMEFTAPGRLRYVEPFQAPGAGTPYTLLDNIRFSSSPIPAIPEPRTFLLTVVGGLLVFLNWCLSKPAE